MNSQKVFRKAKGDFLLAAAGAAVLIVTAISTAALWAIAVSGSGAPSASSSQQAATKASVSLADLALAVGGVLVALMVVALAVNYARRRFARRRGGTHAKASGPRSDSAIRSVTDPLRLNRLADTAGYRSAGDPGLGSPDLPRPAAGASESEDEHASWPGPPGPYALHPDHPSWPGRPDPRWVATESILRNDGYSNWPECQGPPWPSAASPVSENGDRGPPGHASGARTPV